MVNFETHDQAISQAVSTNSVPEILPGESDSEANEIKHGQDSADKILSGELSLMSMSRSRVSHSATETCSMENSHCGNLSKK